MGLIIPRGYGRRWDAARSTLYRAHERKAWDMSSITYRRDRGGASRHRAIGIGVALLVVLNLVTATPAQAGNDAGDRITGSVTIEHLGNHPDNEPGSARVTFEAFEATSKHPARGNLQLDIFNSMGEIGRQITVQVTDVWVEGADGAFIGIVTADMRTSGQDTGHEESGTEPGHDTGHEEPGTDDGHGSGHAGADEHATGKDRTGQLMAVKVTDGGSPGQFDTLDWKWFIAHSIALEDVVEASQLCDKGPKIIVDGNLAVHVKPAERTKVHPQLGAVPSPGRM